MAALHVYHELAHWCVAAPVPISGPSPCLPWVESLIHGSCGQISARSPSFSTCAKKYIVTLHSAPSLILSEEQRLAPRDASDPCHHGLVGGWRAVSPRRLYCFSPLVHSITCTFPASSHRSSAVPLSQWTHMGISVVVFGASTQISGGFSGRRNGRTSGTETRCPSKSTRRIEYGVSMGKRRKRRTLLPE